LCVQEITRRHRQTRTTARTPTPVDAATTESAEAPHLVDRIDLAAIDLLDHANAIRLPTISPAVPASDDPGVEQNLNRISGVDEGIRTPNNRNHKANVASGRNVIPLKINSLQDAPARCSIGQKTCTSRRAASRSMPDCCPSSRGPSSSASGDSICSTRRMAA
jgi:hypothetical protein